MSRRLAEAFLGADVTSALAQGPGRVVNKEERLVEAERGPEGRRGKIQI